eukprot:COSAG01_NODE_10202_length_2222_cov_13.488152_1_plen_238_part_00
MRGQPPLDDDAMAATAERSLETVSHVASLPPTTAQTEPEMSWNTKHPAAAPEPETSSEATPEPAASGLVRSRSLLLLSLAVLGGAAWAGMVSGGASVLQKTTYMPPPPPPPPPPLSTLVVAGVVEGVIEDVRAYTTGEAGPAWWMEGFSMAAGFITVWLALTYMSTPVSAPASVVAPRAAGTGGRGPVEPVAPPPGLGGVPAEPTAPPPGLGQSISEAVPPAKPPPREPAAPPPGLI